MSGNEGTLYYLAARFIGERAAGRAYFQIQKLIKAPECDLSTYRFLLKEVWHVAVVGYPPGEELAKQLEAALATGEATALPEDILGFLQQRRAQQQKQGPWVEAHYHPGVGFSRMELLGEPVQPRFPLGQLVMTTNLRKVLSDSDPAHGMEELASMVARHAAGDWGDLHDGDKRLNEEALVSGGRLFSAYSTRKGIRVWVITEADRSVTTALLPEDY